MLHIVGNLRLRKVLLLSVLLITALMAVAYSPGSGNNIAHAQSGEGGVTIVPIDRAQFLVGQYFDFRVELNGFDGGETYWWVQVNGRQADQFFSKPPVVTNASADSEEYTISQVRFTTPGMYRVNAVVFIDGAFYAKSVNWEVVEPSTQTAQNVILFVGDGMSQPIRTAARLVSGGMTEGKYDRMLHMDDMDSMASIMTSGMDSIITDSANSASAYTTGHKSAVNALGVYPDNTEDPNDDPWVETISELAMRTRGMSVGIVSTADIQDATPASMYGHTRRRAEYIHLTDQLLALEPDVILGGGAASLLPQDTPGSRRQDDRDVFQEFEDVGYTIVDNATQLNAVDAASTDKLLGLFHLGNMNVYLDKAVFRNPDVLQGNTDQPTLWDMTQKAIEVLSKNPNGFVLMVEAASIDKQAHPLDWERTVWDTIEMDKAVGVAKDWAAANGNDTLIMVTADHAHGMSITGSYWEGDGRTGRDGVRLYADAGFPTYVDADGDRFPDEVDVDRTLAVDWANHPDYCDDRIVNTQPLSPAVNVDGVYVANTQRDGDSGVCYTGTLPLSASTGVHTMEDVPLTASGPGASFFHNTIDNTEVFFGMVKALGLDGRD